MQGDRFFLVGSICKRVECIRVIALQCAADSEKQNLFVRLQPYHFLVLIKPPLYFSTATATQVETDFTPTDLHNSIMARLQNTASWACRQWLYLFDPCPGLWAKLWADFQLPRHGIKPQVIGWLSDVVQCAPGAG